MLKKLSMVCLIVMLSTSGVSQANEKNIVETAIAAGNFETLVTAVKAADLVDTLSGHEQFTVLAPTDAAFENLDQDLLSSLLEPKNRAKLRSVLTYHVLPGRVTAADAYDLNYATTVNGQRLNVDFRGDQLRIGNAVVKVSNIQCSNGVIHVIDEVLVPALDTIPAVATSAGQFSTLLAAVGAADLASVLSQPGPFTVFAPTDEAFASLPDGTIESLLKPENKQQLIDILKYHVVSGRFYSGDAIKARRAATLLGRNITADFSAAGLSINDARVVSANIDASNGVIHVIDAVLMPRKLTRRETMSFLTDTIDRGVPVFNQGDHQGCCDIYMTSLKSIESSGIEGVDDHSMSIVRDALKNASQTHDVTQRAWVLRRGIDSLHNRLGQMPMTTNRR